VEAKHISSRAHSRTECCPPTVQDPEYQYIRDEGVTFTTVTAEDRAAHPEVETVELKLFYSSSNKDNFLGVNATDKSGYVVVRAGDASSGHQLPDVVAIAFVTQPNQTFAPLDLYWSEDRKDYQTVASLESRKWLTGYAFVQRLGWVLPVHGYHPSGKCAFGLPSTPFDDPAFADNSCVLRAPR